MTTSVNNRKETRMFSCMNTRGIPPVQDIYVRGGGTLRTCLGCTSKLVPWLQYPLLLPVPLADRQNLDKREEPPGQTDRCKNITFPQSSGVGGNDTKRMEVRLFFSENEPVQLNGMMICAIKVMSSFPSKKMLFSC